MDKDQKVCDEILDKISQALTNTGSANFTQAHTALDEIEKLAAAYLKIKSVQQRGNS